MGTMMIGMMPVRNGYGYGTVSGGLSGRRR